MAILREVGGGFTAVCRSELAREKLTGTAFIQKVRVIVDVFREQARSYPIVLSCQCSFRRGSVPRPILLPSISIAVRKKPYSAIWCIRYSDT